MTTIIDTLEISKDLVQAGFDEKQSNKLADYFKKYAQSWVTSENLKERDLKREQENTSLKEEIHAVKSQIEKLEINIKFWIAGGFISSTGLMISAIKFL